jgi:hypothetical protein
MRLADVHGEEADIDGVGCEHARDAREPHEGFGVADLSGPESDTEDARVRRMVVGEDGVVKGEGLLHRRDVVCFSPPLCSAKTFLSSTGGGGRPTLTVQVAKIDCDIVPLPHGTAQNLTSIDSRMRVLDPFPPPANYVRLGLKQPRKTGDELAALGYTPEQRPSIADRRVGGVQLFGERLAIGTFVEFCLSLAVAVDDDGGGPRLAGRYQERSWQTRCHVVREGEEWKSTETEDGSGASDLQLVVISSSPFGGHPRDISVILVKGQFSPSIEWRGKRIGEETVNVVRFRLDVAH